MPLTPEQLAKIRQKEAATKGIRNSRGKVSGTLKFIDSRPAIELVGNMELLKRPLFPLVCHRADVHLFPQQVEILTNTPI